LLRHRCRALHQHYLGKARQGGAELWVSARLAAAAREAGGCGWRCGRREASCAILVNAAGAWPMRWRHLRHSAAGITRCAARWATANRAAAIASLPLVLDISETFYFKPEAGRIWLSRMTRHRACPAMPPGESMLPRLSSASARLSTAYRTGRTPLAGLRSFAPTACRSTASILRLRHSSGSRTGRLRYPDRACRSAAGRRAHRRHGNRPVDPHAYSPARFR